MYNNLRCFSLLDSENNVLASVVKSYNRKRIKWNKNQRRLWKSSNKSASGFSILRLSIIS